MGKVRRKFSKELKLAVIRELESGVSASEVARKYDVHPALPKKWQKTYYDNPDEAFKGNGNTYKLEARNAELERLVGQLYAENDFLKKAISNLEKRKEERERLAKRRPDS